MANPVIFRKNVDIGAADAESDGIFLDECFVDAGDLAALLDTENSKCIVLGRTGAGKSALIREIGKRSANVRAIPPDALALNYISNSTIIRFFEEAGVNLDIFYGLLWRHIIVVELLKLKFDITNKTKQQAFISQITNIFTRDRNKEKALRYLSEWGDQFWQETDYRTKEFTQKLETNLGASGKFITEGLTLGAEGARKLTEDQKIEVRTYGQHVVNSVQMKELHDVIDLLGEDIFNERQKQYYIVIDRLDEDWVSEDRLRFKLIRALMETIKTFRRVRNVKIVIALRTDLHARIMKDNTSYGFQEEKYKSLYLPIKWTRNQIIEMLDVRITYMFRRQYTTQTVRLNDVMPANQIEQRSSIDYLIERTFFRPREAIIFLNECVAKAEGASRITAPMLRQAEITYSQERKLSLETEWRRDYPSLTHALTLLKQRQLPFTLAEIEDADGKAVAERILERDSTSEDPIRQLAEQYYLGGKIDLYAFLVGLTRIFYQIGIVGVKSEPHLPRHWSFSDAPLLSEEQLKPDAVLDIHKTFWAALGASRVARRSSHPLRP